MSPISVRTSINPSLYTSRIHYEMILGNVINKKSKPIINISKNNNNNNNLQETRSVSTAASWICNIDLPMLISEPDFLSLHSIPFKLYLPSLG